jgi:MYXO-CTERM domain-containing protein
MAAGLAAPALAQTVPTYSINTRWVVDGTAGSNAANAATSISLTLQGQAVFNGSFPASSGSTIYANYGIFSLGFGPAGPTSPSTITRSGFGAATTTLERGNWGSYTSNGDTTQDPPVDPVTVGPLRGAAPGNFNANGNGGTGSFTRGFRFFSGTSAALNNATGNGNSGDNANGRFDASGNLTDFNLLRDDFQSGVRQFRDNATTVANQVWFSLYRITLTSHTPIYLDANGTATVTFNGFLRAGVSSQLVGSSYTMNGGDSVSSTAVARFAIPTPGAAAVLGLAGLAAGRRRR